MNNTKLFVTDLDGTLVSRNNNLSEENRIAINKLIDQGVKVLIATGRGPSRVMKIYDALEMHNHNLPIICFNGGGIYDYQKKSFINTISIDKAIAKKIFLLAIKYGIAAWGFSDNNKDSFHTKGLNLTKYFTLKLYNLHKIEFDENSFDSNLIKMSFSTSEEKAKPFIEEVMKLDLRIIQNVFHITKKYLWDITRPECDKYNAIKWFIEANDINNDQVVTIGDGQNDVLMLKNAGLGIAMGNASDKVKSNAKEITVSCKKGGVAKAINKYILN